jgi:hypothetical protein
MGSGREDMYDAEAARAILREAEDARALAVDRRRTSSLWQVGFGLCAGAGAVAVQLLRDVMPVATPLLVMAALLGCAGLCHWRAVRGWSGRIRDERARGVDKRLYMGIIIGCLVITTLSTFASGAPTWVWIVVGVLTAVGAFLVARTEYRHQLSRLQSGDFDPRDLR